VKELNVIRCNLGLSIEVALNQDLSRFFVWGRQFDNQVTFRNDCKVTILSMHKNKFPKKYWKRQKLCQRYGGPRLPLNTVLWFFPAYIAVVATNKCFISIANTLIKGCSCFIPSGTLTRRDNYSFSFSISEFWATKTSWLLILYSFAFCYAFATRLCRRRHYTLGLSHCPYACPFICSSVRPVRYHYNDISWIAWTILIKQTENIH